MATRPSGIPPPRVRQDENRHRPVNARIYIKSSSSSSDIAAGSASTRSVVGSETSRIPLKASASALNDRLRPGKEQQLLSRTSALAEVTNSSHELTHQHPRSSAAASISQTRHQLKKGMRPIVSTPVPSTETFAQQKSAVLAAPDHSRSRFSRAPPVLVRTVSAPTSSRTSHISGHSSSANINTKRHSYANPPSVSTRLTSTRLDVASIQKSSIAQKLLRVGHSTTLSISTHAQAKAQAALAHVARERTRTISVITQGSVAVPSAPSARKVAPTQKHRTQAAIPTRTVALPVHRSNVPKPATQLTNPNASQQTRPIIPSVPMFETSMAIASPRCGALDQMDMDIEPEANSFDLDPSFVSEYQAEIFAYKREMEIRHLPDPTYMDRQADLSWHYRVRLIEWLVEVHDRFDLLQETMHLCVNYLDRFLSKITIPIDQLQLAGTAALLLASKYEEIQSPAIAELSFLGGEAYPPWRIRQAEIGMLQALNYDMGAPGPMSFLRRISRVDDFDMDIRTLAKYLIDVTLCDHRFIGVPSSMVAAVGYRASMRLLGRGAWTDEHEQCSGYAEYTLSAGINVLLTMLEQPDKTHQSLFNKYQDEKYMGSSTFVQSLGLAKLRSQHYC